MKAIMKCLLSASALILFGFTQIAIAYNIHKDSDDKGITLYGGHEEITEYSIVNLNYDIMPGLLDKLKAAKGTLIKAVADEDTPSAKAATHFYNPATGFGLYDGLLPTAKFTAWGNYTAAFDAYLLGATDTAWSRLGHTLHLLQDMSAPSHVQAAPHMYQALMGKGYEWWVAKNWNSVKNSMDGFFNANPSWRTPSIAGTIDGLMDAVANRTYADSYPFDTSSGPFYSELQVPHTISDAEAAYNSFFLVPQAVRTSGTLFKMFCMHVNCTGTPYPAPNNSQNHATPDDNFDVSSRLIKLEELDVTKQGWKDLYGRTGIKKGYNGLFLEKVVTDAYAKMATTTTEADYNAAAQQFGGILDRAQKEAKHSFEDTYYASADVALFSDAFVDNASELLLKRLKEPIREVKENFSPAALLTNQPVLFIPSGAISDYENSPLLKASLDEYVKNGGTLIVLAQKYGKDFTIIPTPDGKPIAAYGWEEDINCFSDSLYIDTWHQVMSGQNRATPTVNVDGYFTSWPENSTILMRRTANGQPSLLMYEHGQGKVILTSMYTDWAYGHGQTSKEEINLLRDILTWAKKPTLLPEVKAGETANLTLSITNSTSTDAATIKLQVYTPDRSTLLAEQSLSQSLSARQTANLAFAFQANASGALGIHHIDYLLLDNQGTTIQPQAETDSGRFVVSKPPAELTKAPDFNFSVNSSSEHYARGSDATFTVTMYNHTDAERTITAKYFFPHHFWESGSNAIYGGDWNNRNLNLTRTMTVPAKGSASFTHTQNVWANIDRLWAYFYDENGKEVGGSSRGFYVFQPAVDVSVKTAKTLYARGETVNITVNLQNKQNAQTPVKLRIKASDPANGAVYINALDITMAPNAPSVQTMSFTLPATAQGGSYTISAETFDSADNKIGGDSASFELPLSQLSVTPTLPTVLAVGNNAITFNLANSGKVAVNSGTLDVTLKDPDGAIAATMSLPFTLDIGQTKAVSQTLNISSLKFGSYSLSYTQNDETKAGKATIVSLANTVGATVSFDKSSYRIRETASLVLTLTNSGRFNLENVSVNVSVPDAGYTDTRAMNIGQGQVLPVQYEIQLPETIAAGQHTVAITLKSADGSLISKSATFTVPQSALALSLNQAAYVAGSAISPVIANNGGVNTQAQYRISLYDAKSAMIADKSLTEIVPANGTLTLNLPVPVGATDGSYTLVTTYSDQKTGRAEIVQRPLTITGVKAALALQSNKQTYLSTESITALSNIINSGTLLQEGNLHMQVSTAAGSQKQKIWTSKYDFQQAVRDGVDTFGVNDWLIPDDDFSGATINADRWKSVNSVSLQYGAVLVDSTSVESTLVSTWQLDGDFDIQVDFSANNSVMGQGAQLSIYSDNGSFEFYAKNTKAYGNEGGSFVNGQAVGWNAIGSYASSGKLRLTRSGNTITAYSWVCSNWTQILQRTYSRFTDKAVVAFNVWRRQGYPANSVFDNFKVNSGRIATKGETVDSVRLLPLNDNFDSGFLNDDRWSSYKSKFGEVRIENGQLILEGTKTGESIYSGVSHKAIFSGDVTAQTDFGLIEWQLQYGHKFGLAFVVPGANRKYYGIEREFDIRSPNNSYVSYFEIPPAPGVLKSVASSDLSGKFQIKRSGEKLEAGYYNSLGWNILNTAYNSGGTGNFQLGQWNDLNYPNPVTKGFFDKFEVLNNGKYSSNGTWRGKNDSGIVTKWSSLAWSSTEPAGTSIKFRTRTANTEVDLSNATWSDYLTASGTPVTSSPGRWIEVEATLSTTDTNITPLLHDVSVTYGNAPGDILWQADVPLNLAQGAASDLANSIGTLGNAGKYYLQGTVTSGTGQTVATYEYPFFVAQGNTVLGFSPDKRVYKPGETITISGEVKNYATVEAANLSLLLKGKPFGGIEQNLNTETFTIPVGGSRPFTVTTTAGTEGTVTLTGTVTQNGSSLAEIADQFEIAAPKLTATLSTPDTAGNDPFSMSLQLTNSGKTDATITVGKSFSIPETVIVPAGQTQLLQYPQQITTDTAYTFTMTGDLTQSLSKAVKYGLAGTIAIIPQAVYPEGSVAIPATITNSGLLDGQFGVSYQLTQATNLLNQKAASYYITKGGNVADTLNFNLTEGVYQLTATGQLPTLSETTGIVVRKEVKAELTQTIGTQNVASLPVTANVANLGYSTISGVVRLSLLDAQGSAVWSASQDVNLPQSLVPAPQPLAFAINLSSVKTGNYIIKTELLDTGNKQLAAQTAPFTLLAPLFTLTQTPPYQTFQPAGNGTFTFKIRNSGNREGSCNLAFKAGDLSDSSRTEWLKPGEEKEISFAITLPVDLDEKDYNAVYRLTGNGITLAEDVIRYRLSGINLNVTATLDKQQYRPGESATLTLNIGQITGTAPLEMFARVHYNDYDEKRTFTLSGPQSLTFTVPLTAITGEKLFYGIYHQSGRSIHLNTTYVNAANDRLSITSDKQVYNPGETVAATITGNATGSLLLSAPGDYSDTLAFGGTASRGIFLPQDMTAGTYMITAQLTTLNSELITVSHPIDVAGLKVTLKEARLDKAVYSPTDSMKLTITAESNQNISATLRTWVVDPAGTYTEAGSGDIALTAASPLLSTINSQLTTASAGIHKLVYGIYRGNTLIVSGAKAFDIGDALLTAVATDKREYAALNEPVIVKTELFGRNNADLSLMLDGTAVKNVAVSLNGFGAETATLPAGTVMPGRHVVKAVLSAGGLTSTRETEFIYGATLHDLTSRLTVQPPTGEEVLMNAIVTNQGKRAAGQSTLALYDGDPAGSGQFIAAVPVPALDPGASTTVTYTWNCLGKAGEHLIHAVADSGNVVAEFDERNNTAWTPVSLPALVFSVTIGKTIYAANEEAALSVALANLSATNAYPDAVLDLKLTNPAGVSTSLATKAFPLQPAYGTTFVTSWNAGSVMPGGYILKGLLWSGTNLLASQEIVFTVQPTVSLSGGFMTAKDEIINGAALDITTAVTNNGNMDIACVEVLVEIVDKVTGVTVQAQTLVFGGLAVAQTIAPGVTVSKVDVPVGDHLLRLTAVASGQRFALGERPLRVLPPLDISHGIDLAPRVLVFLDNDGDDQERHDDRDDREKKRYEQDGDDKYSGRVKRLIRQALNAGGYYHAIAANSDEFRRELRSGLYNTYILAGARPLTDHLDSELGERVHSGDGLILFGYDKLEDSKMRDLTGTKAEGRLSSGVRSMTLLPSSMTVAGSAQVEGMPLKLSVLSTATQVAATVAEKRHILPMILLNSYGTGKVVVFASDLPGDLLGSAISYVAPVQGDGIPGAPLNASILLKNVGAQFDLRVKETVPASMPILSTRPLGTLDQQSVSWPVNLAKDGTATLAYTVALPESGGRYEAGTEVAFVRNGVCEIYKTISHTLGTERGLADIRNDILFKLRNLQVERKDSKELREALRKYETFLALQDYSAHQLGKVIGRLLEVVEELRKISSDTTNVRLDLDRLLKAYGRKWREQDADR